MDDVRIMRLWQRREWLEGMYLESEEARGRWLRANNALDQRVESQGPGMAALYWETIRLLRVVGNEMVLQTIQGM